MRNLHKLYVFHVQGSKKNARVEGVVGVSKGTRGSVWFQVSGIEDNSGKFGVEAYVLKKIRPHKPH